MPAFDISRSPLIAKSLARAKLQSREIKLVQPPELEAKPQTNIPQDNNLSLNIHGIPKQEMTPAVTEALESLMEEVRVLRSERVRLMEALREAESLADTDAMTGIYNARAFIREMGRIMSFGQRYEIPSSLLFFDLNGFKAINDTFGHLAGDTIIKSVAQTLAGNIRESDIVGRVGGDEFAVLLAKASYDEAYTKAEQLKNAIYSIKVPYGNSMLSVGATVGVYNIEPNDTPQTALEKADDAMYSGKISARVQLL